MTSNNKANEEAFSNVISSAERSLKDCWAKLISVQNNSDSKELVGHAFTSFQFTLFQALVNVETHYNAISKSEQELILNKFQYTKECFSEEMQKFVQRKEFLDEIIDIGKTLGDAFAWIFYQFNGPLLNKHFEHASIPRLPTSVGGLGELEFIRNHQMFGEYFVLSHSITTFLREGDLSLIDLNNLTVATIAELKTQMSSDTEGSTLIFLHKNKALAKGVIPKSQASTNLKKKLSNILEQKYLDRLKRQMRRVENMFQDSPSNGTLEKIGMTLACSKLEELFEVSTPSKWGKIQVGRGLLLIGIKTDDTSFALRFDQAITNHQEVYRSNQESMIEAAKQIVDKNLPDNGILISSLLFKANERYELGLKMRPLFWWPLRAEVREAITFRKMVIITLYNPAFLINDLRRIGLEVVFSKNGGIQITKKHGDSILHFAGINYLYEMIQTHLFSEETIVSFIQKSISSVEKCNIKNNTYVNFDFNFEFQ